MSVEMIMPSRRVRTTAGVRLVVLGARLMARLPPHRLRSLMTRIAASAEPAGKAAAEQILRDVVAISPRCAGWRGCLPRSIAVALLCRVSGFWPDWCVGVRVTPPFAAHAWTEADGIAVAEAGVASDYRALIRVSAGAGSSAR